jgi:ketosteroid isomerase-like protein
VEVEKKGETMDTEEIRRVVLERAAAVAAKDAKAMVAHNAPAIVEYNLAPPLRQPSAGRDVQPAEKWLATFEGPMSMEVTDLEVTAEGSVAFCTSLNRLTATPVGATESFSLWFRVTLGLRRIDGQWLVVHEHESVPFEMDGSFQASVGLQP